MKKTVFFLIIFCAFLNLRAQENKVDFYVFNLKNLAHPSLEASFDPIHPKDVRGSVGFMYDQTESLISYEHFKKSSEETYDGVDLSLTYFMRSDVMTLIKPSGKPNYRRFNFGWGGRIGYVFDYGGSLGCFIKTRFTLTHCLRLTATAGYYGVENWGFYPEARLGLNLTL